MISPEAKTTVKKGWKVKSGTGRGEKEQSQPVPVLLFDRLQSPLCAVSRNLQLCLHRDKGTALIQLQTELLSALVFHLIVLVHYAPMLQILDVQGSSRL